MRFLIDTNVFISSEPNRPGEIEAATELSLKLARVASGYHQLLVHPLVSAELENDTDEERRRLRAIVKGRYSALSDPPRIPEDLNLELGSPDERSHDWYDHQLLGCVYVNAVHGLITQDGGIHRKARRLGVSDRVLTVEDAIALIWRLTARLPDFIPKVEPRQLHAIDIDDQFFNSLKADYPDFADWYRASSQEGRQAFVVEGPETELAGLCILKGRDSEVLVGSNPAKISTFKVDGEFAGNRYGELLLKALFVAVAGVYDALWLTVFEKQLALIALLEDFGFGRLEDLKGERVYAKRLVPTEEDDHLLPPLDFHVKFGPPAIKIIEEQTFIVPIQPEFHASLFPDAPNEQTSFIAPGPHGNALRKAYLSRANMRRAELGATLLFYRSGDVKAVTAVGVLEESLVSRDVTRILEFVGGRTVYSADEVESMANRGDVLAFLFRQDRFLEAPIGLAELKKRGLVGGPPQSMMGVRTEGTAWLKERLDA